MREWVGIDIVIRKLLTLFELRYANVNSASAGQLAIHRTDIPRRTEPIVDFDRFSNGDPQAHRSMDYRKGDCNGCKVHFPFRNFTIDHIKCPQSKGGAGSYRAICSCFAAPAIP